MVKEITGDLIQQSDLFEVIVHGCNCFCAMNSGIAPKIRSKWPEAFEVDCETVEGEKSKLGTISFTKNTSPIIVNAYTQYEFGTDKRNCDYDALKSCMQQIKIHFTGKKIGMPKIGAGLAGGNWNIIKDIIHRELGDEDVTIVLWNDNNN
jgi:O-acetyl-ADP-ribose deacetylase (regulator of RNase III)